MMFSLPSPLTSPRTDDAACVPDVDWDGAAALVGDWLPCGLPALPTASPFGAIVRIYIFHDADARNTPVIRSIDTPVGCSAIIPDLFVS